MARDTRATNFNIISTPFISYWPIIGKATNKQGDIRDLRIWQSRDLSLMQTILTLSNLDPSWIAVTEDFNLDAMAAYIGLCYPLRLIKENDNFRRYILRDEYERIAHNPVRLVFGISPIDRLIIESLSEFPPPGIGIAAIIGNSPNLTKIDIDDLPTEAQQLHKKLEDRLVNITGDVGSSIVSEEIRLFLAGDNILDNFRTILDQETLIERRQGFLSRIAALETAQNTWNTALAKYTDRTQRPDYDTTWNEVIQMIRDLTAAYGQHYDRHKNIIPNPMRVMPDGTTFLPTTKVMGAFHRGLITHDYIPDNDGIPYFEAEKKGKSSIGIRFGPKKNEVLYNNALIQDEILTITTQAVWDKLRKKTDLHAIVFLILCIHAWNKTYQNGVDTIITIDQILDYRNVQKILHPDGHYGGHRTEDKEVIRNILDDLERFYITYKIVGTKSGAEGSTYAIDIRERHKQWDLFGGSIIEGYAYQIGRALQTPPEGLSPQYIAISQSILAYDSYHERWESRLGVWAMFQFRLSNGYPQPVSINQIMQELSLDDPDKNKPIETRRRLEKALDRLKEDQIIEVWSYVNQIQLPHKNWLLVWKEWQILIKATSLTSTNLQGNEEKRQQYIEAQKQRITNAEVRQRQRKKKGD